MTDYSSWRKSNGCPWPSLSKQSCVETLNSVFKLRSESQCRLPSVALAAMTFGGCRFLVILFRLHRRAVGGEGLVVARHG